MRILIIEDEKPAARRLTSLVKALDPSIEIVDILDSVSAAVAWFKTFSPPDLVFLDIQLADGLSFEIFSQVEVDAPIIFTTAYDQFALKAFKVNSVDYLIKPIDPEELKSAWEKFNRQSKASRIDAVQVRALLDEIHGPQFKERFWVKSGEQLNYLSVDEIAYFLSDSGVTQAVNYKKIPFALDKNLESLEEVVDPKRFFRVNRKLILIIESIEKIHTWFNGRLKLDLNPDPGLEVFVSRDRVNDFKSWLDR